MIRRLPLLLLAACGDWEVAEQDGLLVLTRQVGSGADRRWVAEVPVDDHQGLLLTAVLPTEERGYVASVTAPDGEVVYRASDWWEAPRSKTNAGFASSVLTVAWPIAATDRPLEPGTWDVELRTDRVGVDLDTTALLKRDPDLAAGRLVADVRLASDLQRDPGLVEGVRQALGIWADEIYVGLGIEVDLAYRDWDGPAGLASPGYGDGAAYLDAVQGKPLRAVQILVVRRITDASNVLGVSGGIPGALAPTDRSAVTVSAEEAAAAVLAVGEAAGPDLVFDAAEERLLAETVAHEVGHFLGLFHPAELPATGQRVTRWDALDDTPECPDLATCADRLGDNLMFPTPVCDDPVGACTFVRQESATAAQRGVLQRAVAVE